MQAAAWECVIGWTGLRGGWTRKLSHMTLRKAHNYYAWNAIRSDIVCIVMAEPMLTASDASDAHNIIGEIFF